MRRNFDEAKGKIDGDESRRHQDKVARVERDVIDAITFPGWAATETHIFCIAPATSTCNQPRRVRAPKPSVLPIDIRLQCVSRQHSYRAQLPRSFGMSLPSDPPFLPRANPIGPEEKVSQ
jgi:hypothetical protein